MIAALTFPNIDPIAISLGPLAIRWYSLAYIGGLLLAWWYCRWLTTRPPREVSKEAFDDFLLWATLGIILGGRLGYVLFYKPGFYLANPQEILMVWRGGMSFHGGLLGVAVAEIAFARRRGIPLLALTDIVAGHVDMFFDTLATSVPLYRDNKVKLMGVADLKRAGVIPEIPTLSEAGLPGFKSITWFGLVAPPATPAALAEKINRDVVEILNRKDASDALRKLSLETGATAPAETARFFAEETALWSKVIKEAGIEPQ